MRFKEGDAVEIKEGLEHPRETWAGEIRYVVFEDLKNKSYLLNGCGLTPFTDDMLDEALVELKDIPFKNRIVRGPQNYKANPYETPYSKNIADLMHKQIAKGLTKYGETLEDNKTLTTEQRIEHLQEELIDGLQYCEHLKAAYKDNLTANDYQRAALRTAGEKPENYLDNAILGLCGEVGEVADIIKKHRHQGHELNREHLIEELGDVCWYIALMATALDMPLEAVLQRNINKLKKRYPDGFDKARSINREA